MGLYRCSFANDDISSYFKKNNIYYKDKTGDYVYIGNRYYYKTYDFPSYMATYFDSVNNVLNPLIVSCLSDKGVTIHVYQDPWDWGDVTEINEQFVYNGQSYIVSNLLGALSDRASSNRLPNSYASIEAAAKALIDIVSA